VVDLPVELKVNGRGVRLDVRITVRLTS